jgi:pimeloyl-ACP methyl ester carboxylesterase
MATVILKRMAVSTVLALAAIYLGLAGWMFFSQRSLLYPRPRNFEPPRLPGAQLVRFLGREGREGLAFYLPARPGAPTMVHFHGNAEQLASVIDLAAAEHEAGLGFFALEYPGYGASARLPVSERTIYQTAEAGIVELTERFGVATNQIVLQGQSLGTGVAAEMARRGYGTRLVLISPFTSIADLAARAYPFLPARLFVLDRFDTAAKAPRIRQPVLILHGEDDEILPLDMAKRLGHLFPRAEVVVLPGRHHNDMRGDNLGHLVNTILAFLHGH